VRAAHRLQALLQLLLELAEPLFVEGLEAQPAQGRVGLLDLDQLNLSHTVIVLGPLNSLLGYVPS
jgi:hypothetical protein